MQDTMLNWLEAKFTFLASQSQNTHDLYDIYGYVYDILHISSVSYELFSNSTFKTDI